MTVPVADIDRWSPEDVREVFRAAHGQAAADFDTSTTIATLPAFREWGGDAARAAASANEQLRRDLDASGNEALAVARAADVAADDMERVRADLAALEAEAAKSHFLIDRSTSRVVPGPGFAEANPFPMVALADMAQYQDRLDTILAHAAAVDDELAEAIRMATGAEAIPEPPKSNAELDVIISGPLPKDPEQFNKLWEQLNREQRNRLFARDPWIGNTDGMPSDDRDYYNRLHLTDLMAHGPSHQADLLALHQAVQLDPNRKLLLLDTRTPQVHAAVAIGDLDDATTVAGTTPGLNTTVAGSMVGMTTEASNLRQATLQDTRTTRGRRSPGSDTTRPKSPDGTTSPGRSRAAGASATTTSPGRGRRTWPTSTTVCNPLTRAARPISPRSGTPMVPSPPGWPCRILATTESATRSATAHPASRRPPRACCSCSRGTSTPWRPRTTRFRASTTPSRGNRRWWPGARSLVAFWSGPGRGISARTRPATHMATGPAAVPDGHGGTMNLEGAQGHSDYPRWGGNNLPRTTGYNIAAVVAGLPNNVVPQN